MFCWSYVKKEEKNETGSNGRVSPSLDDLEEKKLRLLSALQGNELRTSDSEINADSHTNKDNSQVVIEDKDKEVEVNEEEQVNKETEPSQNIEGTPVKIDEEGENTKIKSVEQDSTTDSESDVTKTPTSSVGKVKTTAYGTPVMNIASSFTKLPTDDKFAKDICDVINFENLPNSTGKYKKICKLLKKVKQEVDRIQDS